jgi:hypothetical protein
MTIQRIDDCLSVGDVLALLDTGAYQEVSILKEAAH